MSEITLQRIISMESEATETDGGQYILTDSDSGTKKMNVGALMANDAPAFSSSTAYSAGDIVVYNTKLYKFSADHSAGAWVGTDAEQITLGGELSDVKSDLSVYNISGLTRIHYTTGGYINTGSYNVGDTVPMTVTPGTYRAYALFDCSPGTQLTVTATSGSNYRAFSFLDADNKLLFKDSGSQTRVNYVVTAPANTAKALVCADTEYDYSCIIGASWKTSINKSLGVAIDGIKKSVSFSVSGFLNKSNGNIVASTYYACTPLIPLIGVVPFYQYDVITYSNIAICVFYDIKENFISSIASESATLREETGAITVYPSNAAYVRFCSDIENDYVPFVGAYSLGDIELRGKYVDVENLAITLHDPKSNLINPAECILGYINGGTDGSVHYSDTFYCTPYIPLEAGKQYYFNGNYLYAGYCAFYDENKEYISGYDIKTADSYLPSPFTVPVDAAYGRFTIASENKLTNAWVCETNQMSTKPPAYTDYVQTTFLTERPTNFEGSDITIFNKILCIGDSLTDGFFNENGGSRLIIRKYAYPTQLQKISGVECTNMGYAGYTSAQWFTAFGNEDLSGHDACIIQLGVNDGLNNVSESDMDTALTNIINKVKADNSGIKIFVATIIPANAYMTTTMQTRAQMIRDFVASLNDPNVYLLDMWKYGHTDDLLAFDAGHLSAYGYLQLAMDYKAYISYIIRNNPNDFRLVQFIGTNYTYTADTEVRVITY